MVASGAPEVRCYPAMVLILRMFLVLSSTLLRLVHRLWLV